MQAGGKRWGEEFCFFFFSWRTSGGAAGAREGILVCFFEEFPSALQSFVELLIYLFIPSSTWRQRRLSWHCRGSEGRREFLTLILLPKFRHLKLPLASLDSQEGNKDASRGNLNIDIVPLISLILFFYPWLSPDCPISFTSFCPSHSSGPKSEIPPGSLKQMHL